jgi:protein-S-isoprenylcysteine O-methyltransferase Ste14
VLLGAGHRSNKAAHNQDRDSRRFLLVMVVIGLFIGYSLDKIVNITEISFDHEVIFWTGIFLIYAGMAFRYYAAKVLGLYFTKSVKTVPEQRIIESGPYRFIRHPSYSGALLTLLGFALAATNWLSMIIILVFTFIAYGYRIYVEEKVLLEQFGDRYREYMKRTKRLIPFIF